MTYQKWGTGQRTRTLAGRLVAASLFFLGASPALAAEPIEIAEQGSFYVGGETVRAPGDYDPQVGLADAGQGFEVGQLYASYQIPVDATRVPLVLVHGGGQTGKTYESTPDGREGFATLFLRRGHPVYVVDLPTRGRAGAVSFTGPFGELAGEAIGPDTTLRVGDRFAWTLFRLGPSYGEWFEGSQFPKDGLDQFLKQSVAWVEEDHDAHAEALTALFERIGPAVLVTHSRGGYAGWLTATKTDNVRAIVAYEPIQFAFPDEVPESVPRSFAIPADSFAGLTRPPMQIVFGDFLPEEPVPDRGLVVWHFAPRWADTFAEAVRSAGGTVDVVRLPDIGIRGNTHFPMSDLNNVEVADQLEGFLAAQGVLTAR